MAHLDRMLRFDQLYERLDGLSASINMLEDLTERAGEFFPQHAQQLEAILRDVVAAKDAARLDIEDE